MKLIPDNTSHIFPRLFPLTRYPIIKLEKSQLVDTNGAGDAYVGGFLSKLVQGCSMEICCREGAEAACVIVQRSGCTFPDA